MATAKKTTVEQAAELAQELLEEMDLFLWDVTYAKEGSVWILRYLVDKDDGLTILDCEAFSRAVELLLDEADFIPQSYTLEVSSPGVERELTQDWHFQECRGERVDLRLIRPRDGVRDFTGALGDCDGGAVTLELPEGGTLSVNRSDTAYIRLHYEF